MKKYKKQILIVLLLIILITIYFKGSSYNIIIEKEIGEQKTEVNLILNQDLWFWEIFKKEDKINEEINNLINSFEIETRFAYNTKQIKDIYIEKIPEGENIVDYLWKASTKQLLETPKEVKYTNKDFDKLEKEIKEVLNKRVFAVEETKIINSSIYLKRK